jgi:hypothetical protein
MQQRVYVLFALLLLPAAARAALSHEMDSKLSFTNTAAGESATTVTFKVTYKGTGWFGLGMGGGAAGGMVGSDIVICTDGGTVKRYHASGYSKPIEAGTVADASCSYSSTAGTMTFTRNAAAATSSEVAIPPTGKGVKMIYGYDKDDASKALVYHSGASRGKKTVDLCEDCASPASPSPSDADGDKKPSADGEFALGDKLSARSTVNGDDVSFVVTFAASSGWFALGVSSDGSMTSGGEGSDVVVCDSAGAKRYWITNKSPPSGGVAVDGAVCEFANGEGVLSFTRALKASGAKQRDMLGAGSETTLIYAHGTPAAMAYHSGNRGSVGVDLASGSGSGIVATPVPGLVWAHALLMLLSWGMLLPAGVVVARTQRNNPAKVQGAPLWFGLHRILQYSGWTLQLAGFAIILAQKNGSHFQSSATVGLVHMFFGLVIVIVGTLQPLNAFFRPHPTDPEGNKTANRKKWEMLHKGCGYFAVMGGPINCVLAVILSASLGYVTSFTATTGVILGVTSIPLLVFGLLKGGGADVNKHKAQDVALEIATSGGSD